MLASIIIMFISLILDGILTNFLPYLVSDLSIFTPMLTVIGIFIVYPYFYKNNKKYFIFSFICGVIYDLFYTNLYVVDGIIFLLIAFVTVKINKNIQVNVFSILYQAILAIILYEVSLALIFVIFNVVPITFLGVLYKISHSILLNVIYAFILYFILKNFTVKYFKRGIN